LATAESQIKTLFKAEFASDRSSVKLRLAVRLLEFAKATNNDAAARYVLCREAADIASRFGEARVALIAIDLMAADFQVNPLPLKCKALDSVLKAATVVTGFTEIARAAIDLMDLHAIEPDNFEITDDLMRIAKIAAAKSENRQIVAIVKALPADIEMLKRDFERAKSAKRSVASQPDDEAANAVYGEYLCYSKGDWVAGLPYLAKGSDPKAKELAATDLTKPKPASEQKALADGWWAIADRYTSTDDSLRRRNLLDRAVLWYLRAISRLPPLEQASIALRIAQGQSQISAIVAMRQLPPPAEIREYGWVQGGPRIKTIRSDEGFCFLSGIAGKFEGGGEILSVYPEDAGWWYFDAISYQAMGGRALSVQTPFRKLFKTEVQMSEWTPKNLPVKMISRYEGFCLLSLIKGKFEGATDAIGVSLAADGNWYLAGRTNNDVQGVHGRALSMRLIDPGSCQVKITEYQWGAGGNAVRMCHKNEGFCFLSAVTGGFRSTAEDVRVYVGKDGYWYLTGRSGQSTLAARAMSMVPLRTLPEKDRMQPD
jgi:hypothetical protein